MSFVGYSVTVGRLNLFCQSFLFMVHCINGNFVKDLLGMNLIAMNATIRGISSFPYGWCLPKCLGEYYNLVSWNYSMTKDNRDHGLDRYFCNDITSIYKLPMIMVLDNKGTGIDLLQRYVQSWALEDTFVVKRGEGLISPTIMSLP